MRHKLITAFWWCAVLGGGLGVSHGQWTTQTVTLQPGWNAVYLEVQPVPDDGDLVFAGIPVESVWAWNRQFSTVQFVQDPNELAPGRPDWLTYLPADNAARATRNLFHILGARAYLVKLKANAAPTEWKIVGRPTLRSVDWLPDSYNFVGFPMAGGAGPSFQSFFANAPAHAGLSAYRLNGAGAWELIAAPATTSLRAGEAYWVYSKGASSFAGPLSLTLEQRDGLLYGRDLMEQTVRIKNDSGLARSITVENVTSQMPPGSEPLLAGAVPLSYYKIDAAARQFGWVPLIAPLQKLAIRPGEEWVLRLEVNRARMAAYVPPAVHNGVLYQSLLQITSDQGVRHLIPVSAEGLKALPASGASVASVAQGAAAPEERAGLWVGSAVINKVSQPGRASSPDAPVAVGSPVEFRLLLHVDSAGKVRLLQRVLQMYKNGTLKQDPIDPTQNVVDQPGRYVLVTDETLIPQFTGATLRDGQPVARRISSAAFSFSEPILVTPANEGALARFGVGSFHCEVHLGFDDPLNPFKHVYHPDHDNLDERFQQKLADGQESIGVGRQIQFEFTTQDPDNLTIAGWGDNQVGGAYRETITGLHRRSIQMEGSFRLSLTSRIAELNDGQTAAISASR